MMRNKMLFAFMDRFPNRKFGFVVACVGVLFLAGCDTPEEKVQNHYNSGQELLEEGNLVKAGLEFRNALQINEKFIPAIFGMAQLEERQGNIQRARGLYGKVIDLDPKHYEASIKYGKFMLVAGQLDRALELSDLVMSLDGTKAEALAFRAAVLFKLEDPAGAISNAKKALEVDPANVEAITVLAAERIAAKDFKGAIGFLKQGLKLNEKDITLNLIKVQALGFLKDTDEVEAVIKRLINFYPETRGFKTALVRFYLRQKRVDDAESIIRSIAASAPNDLSANLDVVRFVSTLRGVKAAEDELKALVERGGENLFSYQLTLAKLLFASGEKEAAKTILLDVIATSDTEESRLEAKNRLAELLIADGKPEEARKLVAEILARDSRNADGLLIRASIMLADKKIDDAITDLRTVLKGEPDSIRALMMLGAAHALNGSVELADDRMTGAFQASKFSPRVGLVYTRFLIKNGALGRAEDALIKVLIRAPRNLAALRALAQVRISRQNWIGAQEVSDILAGLGDDKSITNQIKAIALQGQDKATESIAAYEDAHAAKPDALRPMVSLVRAYVRNGQLERAEKFVQAVLKSTDKNVYAKVIMAQLQALGGKSEQAEATYREAIRDNPEESVAYTSLIAYFLGQNKTEDASMTVSSGLEKIPGNVPLNLLKANILERGEDYEGAVAQYEKLYQTNPNSEVIINNLASMLSEYSTDDAVIARAQDMAKRFRNSSVPYFKDTFGWIQYRMGNFDEATSLLKDVVAKAPNDPRFRYHLGMSYLASERTSSAIQEFEKALELSENQPFAQAANVKKILAELRTSSPPSPDAQN